MTYTPDICQVYLPASSGVVCEIVSPTTDIGDASEIAYVITKPGTLDTGCAWKIGDPLEKAKKLGWLSPAQFLIA